MNVNVRKFDYCLNINDNFYAPSQKKYFLFLRYILIGIRYAYIVLPRNILRLLYRMSDICNSEKAFRCTEFPKGLHGGYL